jgi:hypothetical protein
MKKAEADGLGGFNDVPILQPSAGQGYSTCFCYVAITRVSRGLKRACLHQRFRKESFPISEK